MKTLTILLASFFFTLTAFSQDLVGTHIEHVKMVASKFKNLQIFNLGDTSIRVANNNEAATGICTEEDVQFNADDIDNVKIMNQFFNIRKVNLLQQIQTDFTLENSTKIIKIIREGSILHIHFKLKVAGDLMLCNIESENRNIK
jgi:hypothetical protein